MSVTYDYRGKTALVTGAASGLGRATALVFARVGAQVALVDLSADGLEETAKLVTANGGQALVLSRDVTDEDDVQAAVDHTVERFGRLDAAFNNAGVKGFKGQAVYAAAKHGVIGFTRSDASASPRRSPPPCCGCARTTPPSPPAPPSSSTAARPPDPACSQTTNLPAFPEA